MQPLYVAEADQFLPDKKEFDEYVLEAKMIPISEAKKARK